MTLPQPPLLVISDRKAARLPLDEVAAAAFRAGCRWFSLREKDLDPRARLAAVRRLRPLARSFGARLMVHGDLDAATLAGGVHLPRDGDVAAARRRLGSTALLGLSAHDLGEAAAAAAAGADYVTLSPVFSSPGKPGYGPTLGPATVAAVAAAVSAPVIALGGVGAHNARACIAAGAAGVAVQGAVMAARDPARAVREIVAALGPERNG